MTTYALAQYSWDDVDVVTVSSRGGQLIGTFPLDFLRRGGIDTWTYVLDVVGQLVDHGEGGVIRDENGRTVDPSAAPESGDFWFDSLGEFAGVKP